MLLQAPQATRVVKRAHLRGALLPGVCLLLEILPVAIKVALTISRGQKEKSTFR